MRQIRAWLFRFAGSFKKRQRDRELSDELQSALDMHTEEHLRQGLGPEEARRRAMISLGGLDQIKEIYRERRSLPAIEGLLRDLRYGVRTLARSPGFALAAIVSLALGIGANSAIFSIAEAALWRNLPVADSRSLVVLMAQRQDHSEIDDLPRALAEPLRRSAGVFSDVIATSSDGLSFSYEGGRSERIVGEVVSPNYFASLGIRPFLGRGFSGEIRKAQWAAETVLSYRFWQQRFGGDPKVIGQTVELNSYPFTIVGVSPPGFFGLVVGFDPELRLTMMPAGQTLSQMELISDDDAQIVCRLRPGVTLAQAESVSDRVFQQFLRENARAQLRVNRMTHLDVRPGEKGYQDLDEFRQPLLILLVLAGLVLLIACSNIANMLLARGTGRARELAVRAAIGAGRATLVRQLLSESLILSVVGGAFGYAIASWTSAVLFRFLPQGHIAITLNVAPDSRTALFTAGAALAAGVLFGLWPAIAATRGNLVGLIKCDSAGSIGGARGLNARKVLLASQVALSLLLLVVTGLFVRTLHKLNSNNQFSEPGKVLLFTMKPQHELYSPEKMRTLTAEVLNRIGALARVRSVGLAERGPVGSLSGYATIKTFDGRSARVRSDRVSSGFFDTIGIPLIAGRDFSPTDKYGSQPVVLINDVVARQLFGASSGLGEKILLDDEGREGSYEIMGIVSACRYYDLHSAPGPAVYTDIQQGKPYMPTLHVQITGTSCADMINEIRREFDSIDKGFPVFNVRTLQDRIDDSLARERLVSDLAGAFGLLALALAMVGLYAVTTYSVARRGREIGIRIALGARPGSVLALVLKEAVVLVVAGAVAGIPASVVASRVLANRLDLMTQFDALTAAGAIGLMIGVALLAAALPARRASRVGPNVALRYD